MLKGVYFLHVWNSKVLLLRPIFFVFDRHEIEILLGDRVLPYNMTVYQAVKQFGHCDEERDADEDHGVLGRPSIWVATHTIWYGSTHSKSLTVV